MIGTVNGDASLSRRVHTVRVAPGVTLNVVEKWAVEDCPVVLFVHGLGVGAGYWDLPVAGYSSMDYMAERGMRAYALDHRGYGSSTLVPGSSVRAETAARDVAAVIDYIERDSGANGVCLVGHSWGGMIAAMSAALRTDSVRSVVLVGMPYRRVHWLFQERLGVIRAAGTPVDGWIPNPTHLGLEERLHAHDTEVLDAYVKMVETDYNRIPVGILDDCAALPHSNSLVHLECPVLLVCGTGETVVDRADMLHLLDDLRAADKALVFVGAGGHLAGLEQSSHGKIDGAIAGWALTYARREQVQED